MEKRQCYNDVVQYAGNKLSTQKTTGNACFLVAYLLGNCALLKLRQHRHR